MTSVWKQLESILLRAQKPSSYIGGEVNSVAKDHTSVDLKVALIFPDTYQIGMSHLGLQILYGVLNKQPNILAERAFAPWVDLELLLREKKIPLFSLETHTPLKEFDILGISLQYELSYTNVLNILDLAGIPLKSSDRAITDPLIIAGGPVVFNPEPMADFIDIFVVGDGEEKIVELSNEYIRLKKSGIKDRQELIKELAKNITSLYAPSLYDVEYHPDNRIKSIKPKEKGIPEKISKAIVEDLDNAYYPLKPVIPFSEAVHNRINLEVMRGCPHSCRFCVSNIIKSPIRYRSVETLLKYAEEIYNNTGYDEISLLSLSTGDYPHLAELLTRLNARFKSKKVSISLPSLYINESLKELPEVINAVRKSGLTLAPETGSARLRQVIDKNIDDNDFFGAIRAAYRNGWNLIKLYFMVGLPGEQEADINAIPEMIMKTSQMGKEIPRQNGQRGLAGNINVTISPFTPKAHTAFQWAPMDSLEVIKTKQSAIRNRINSRHIKLKFHKIERNFLEGVFSRGDRRLGRVIMDAWKSGCKFDAWDETFNFPKWIEAFKANNISPEFYASRERAIDEVLPWSMIESGVSAEMILRERKLAEECIAGGK
jgi:radical SAM family uncharacterized protein